MNQLLSFWYGQSPNWVYRHFLETIQALDGHLAVRDTLRNLTKPIFQDYTYQGRIIGFFLRVFRILISYFLYLLTFLAYLLVYLVWLAFPLVCLVSLIGAFMGPA